MALALLALILAACGGPNQETMLHQRVSGAAATVIIEDSPESVGYFDPQVVHIHVGQTVGWLNASGDYHTVTFDQPGAPRSSRGFGHGAEFRATFGREGTFRYRCLYHDGMTGTVVVSASAGRH
ncbi:MAG TPA: plastocyanin/azurin family copper-binding protein [Candidatus Dormibacteraeota bacterium]|nr:plastocyanin/azurin family copper-binding protein [Candidatus Dormibacteraeota bacterium]